MFKPNSLKVLLGFFIYLKFFLNLKECSSLTGFKNLLGFFYLSTVFLLKFKTKLEPHRSQRSVWFLEETL